MLGYLAYCYFTIGFVVSFPSIAIQFVFMEKLHSSPISMAMSYGIIAFPWCIKPIYGYISDKYTIFDWGKRRPYISFTGLLASYMYIIAGAHLDNIYSMVSILTVISLLICVADVCADSITVELVRNEKNKGVIQSNNWIARAFGTLVGAFFGGMAYNELNADAVFKITAIIPFLMSVIIWQLPKSETNSDNIGKRLYANFLEQRELALILFLITVAPNYSTFYTYFLRKELNYTPIDFTWLSMGSSISFLLGIMSYRMYFRKFEDRTVLTTAVVLATCCRITQIFVVGKNTSSFTVVLLDGIADSFCGQLLIMPLIVYTAQKCNKGVEGALFALMMSISNISGVIADEMGALVAAMFQVTEDDFTNLVYMVALCIVIEIGIQIYAIRRMFSASSTAYQKRPTSDLSMIDSEMYSLE